MRIFGGRNVGLEGLMEVVDRGYHLMKGAVSRSG
jgi:hypothetical protein